jgi:hypothetical protein
VTEEGEERLESEFFDKKGAEKVDSFISLCFVWHGEKESVIPVLVCVYVGMYGCMYVCLCVRMPMRERKMGGIWE